MSEELGYYPYLNCVEQVIIVISQCISISLYSNLLFRVVFRRRFLFCQPKSLRDLSSAIIFFMVYHVIFSVVAFPYGAYQMVEWFSVLKNTDHQPHRKVADPLFFWLGMFSTNYIYLAPIPMFFLTLDRCLLLKYQHGYNKVLRRRMLVSCCLFIGTAYFLLIISYLFELPITSQSANCMQFTCFILKTHGVQYYYVKNSVEIIQIFLSLYFFSMLKNYQHLIQTPTQKRNMNVIKFTLIADIFLNVLPTLTGSIFNTTAGINIGKYLGSFINMPFMVHATLCSIIYSKILLFGYNPSGVVLEKTAKSRSSSNKIHVSSPL